LSVTEPIGAAELELDEEELEVDDELELE